MLGKMIQVDNVQGTFVGRAAGIDNTGALLLAQDDKKISIRSGHITYLKDQQYIKEEIFPYFLRYTSSM